MKLSDYLEALGETHESFAQKIGVSQVAISRYANGQRLPRPHVLAAIIEQTKGAVTANDFEFVKPKEQAA
jgi:transcriptional regulator with XRE-family HTH domain